MIEELIKTYEPINSEDQLYFWLGLVMAIAAFGAMTIIIRKEFSYEEQSKKWLIALLLFIVGLIASGTSVFSWLSQQKMGMVKIYSDHIEIGKTSLNFFEIKKIDLKKEQEKSFVNPNIVRSEYYLLFIENLEGKTFVISEQGYPVREIMLELRKAIEDGTE